MTGYREFKKDMLTFYDWGPVDVVRQRDDGTIVLEHQCDEWEIGGVDDARAFIADLEALLESERPR